MTVAKPINPRVSIRKSVFGSHSDLAHVWAQNKYTSGRSSDDRMSFDGAKLYSYGSHFALGYVMDFDNGRRVYLLNTDSHSISTGKHKHHASYAVSGEVYNVPSLTSITWELDAFVNGNLARATPGIKTYLKENCLRMSAESVEFLANLIKCGRSTTKWKREATAKAAERKAKEKAADIASRKGDAMAFATMTDSAFETFLDRRIESPAWGKYPAYAGAHYKSYRRLTAGEMLATVATELHRCNVTAKAHLGKRMQAALKARLAAVRARSKTALKWESHSEKLAQFMRYKKTFRTYVDIANGRAQFSQFDKEAAATITRLCEYFQGLRHTTPSLAAKLAELNTLAVARHAEIVAAAAKERMEKERAGREEWLNGTAKNYTRYSDEMGRALIRANGEMLETSHGASVPLKDAIRAFQFVKLVRERGKGWNRNGATLPVGHFQIDAIDTHGNFIAGCHKIGWNEISRLAEKLGLADIAAADTTAHS